MRAVKQRAAFLFAPAEVSRDGENKVTGFAGVAYSGGVVPNYGWRGDMAIDLSGMQLPPGRVPITFGHNDDNVDEIIGHASVVNDGASLRLADGRFSEVTDAGRKAAALMAEGQPFMFSVGVNGRSLEADRNVPTQLNGREMRVDTVMRNARLLHVSFVNAGADPNAHAARLSASMGQQPDEEPSNMDNAHAERVTELERQIEALTTERDTFKGERDAARTELANIRLAARNAAIEALFGKEHGFDDAQLAAYREMSDVAFGAVEKGIAAARKSADPTLFAQRATNGRDHEGGGSAASITMPADKQGMAVDPARAALHAKALAYAAEHKVDYVDAVKAVAPNA